MAMYIRIWLSLVLGCLMCPRALADEGSKPVQLLLQAKCAKCHGDSKPRGGIKVQGLDSSDMRESRANLLQRILTAIDSNEMPPEAEPQFTREERENVTRWLKDSLRKAAATSNSPVTPLHRLTRLQYNYAVRDLFRLNRDVFELPEKLMTRRDRYVPSKTGKMPEQVRVASLALTPEPGLMGVKPFPKDLRAEHGFDNQANKLTLSPLLLDAFLRLSVSIVESPDFNDKTVGIWSDFFLEPAGGENRSLVVTRRLKPFLRLAFRRPVDDETLKRYVAYAESKLKQGLSFTDSMKKVASAVLCSPLFLYRSAGADGSERQIELASQLSFFLWSSLPDAELLDLAERGELSNPEVLRRTVDRLLADPKVERFLDTYPTQWLQLENLLGVTPDPKKSPYFRVDENYPASLAMVLEPLLLFDSVFVENRPIIDLISPPFSYRNAFLRDWYDSNLKPPMPTPSEVAVKNLLIETQRRPLEAKVAEVQTAIDAIVNPINAKWMADRKRDSKKELSELKPLAAWDFNGNLKDSIGGFDLTSTGKVKFEDGQVVLDGGYLQSGPLPSDLKAKTLEVWCELPDIRQRGGGVMTIEGPNGVFDSIVFGERMPQHWISGSNGFARTEDFAESEPESRPGQRLHLVMVYEGDGTTRLYRNGVLYGKPFRKGSVTFPKGKTTVLFGLRHLPAGGNKHLAVRIDRARLYDYALTAADVEAAWNACGFDIPEKELMGLLSTTDAAKLRALRETRALAKSDLAKVPRPYDLISLRRESERQFEEQLRAKLRSPVFERVPLTSPRSGGVITNAAVMSMTSGPLRTQPIARGAWIIEAIFNDPPAPPPNNVPPLKEDDNSNLTIREQFAAHRNNPSCAACHARIDPLGFALENFDITGRWRETYENGRSIDASGTLLRKHSFVGAAEFKAAIVKEKERFAHAFTRHLLRYALARELTPADNGSIDEILRRSQGYQLQVLVREVAIATASLASSRTLPDSQPSKSSK